MGCHAPLLDIMTITAYLDFFCLFFFLHEEEGSEEDISKVSFSLSAPWWSTEEERKPVNPDDPSESGGSFRTKRRFQSHQIKSI